MGGFEPPTVGLTGQCSTNELHRFGDAIHGRRPSPSGTDLRNALRATPGEHDPTCDGSLDGRPRAAAGLPPSLGIVPRGWRGQQNPQLRQPSPNTAFSPVRLLAGQEGSTATGERVPRLSMYELYRGAGRESDRTRTE